MFDERAFIGQVEAANADTFAELLARPNADQEAALRAYFGEVRYQRMHSLALRRNVNRSLMGSRPRGNVVVLHGIMGGELTAFDRGGSGAQIWVRIFRLATGAIARLRLNDDGRHEFDDSYDVRATGIMKRDYGELLLRLAQRWNVRAFWFDWRRDIEIAADALAAQISAWFDPNAPVHLVAHSMGGLVARAFIKKYPERWRSMWDGTSTTRGALGGRLVMLGTPNHGSFAIPQVIVGLDGMVRKLAVVDLHHSLTDLLRIVNSFVGSYQMLPSPLVIPAVEDLYRSETYGDISVPQQHLDRARRLHQTLAPVVDPERMVYIAGTNRLTFNGIRDMSKIASAASYETTMLGDGRVSHKLGLLVTARGRSVPTYYVDEIHGDLPSNESILTVLDQLLESGETTLLGTQPSRSRAVDSPAERQRALQATRIVEDSDERRLRQLVGRLQRRSSAPAAALHVNAEEHRAEALLTRGYLASPDGETVTSERLIAGGALAHPPSIEIRVARGHIEDVSDDFPGPPVDAIAVGHYVGVKPQFAELALDRAISAPLYLKAGQAPRRAAVADLLLTLYTERGIIRGELGQPFFITDPRGARRSGKRSERVIALAGMGLPGRFGPPELTVLARELVWSLGRLGKQHLATVLIGAGAGNIRADDAVRAWLRGIKATLRGAAGEAGSQLLRVTFVDLDPKVVKTIDETIRDEQERLAQTLSIDYQTSPELVAWTRRHDTRRKRQRQPSVAASVGSRDPMPTRLTVGIEGTSYRFGAITTNASIPERTIALDPALVMEANTELAGETESAMQLTRGQFMQKLLVPQDLRDELRSAAPVVIVMDATTARIHWEMLALDEIGAARGGAPGDAFLGTSRGLTRQLRTTFAPPPEPPPPPQRLLRVLVIADPAEDNPLPGAEEEGVEVADLFEAFNAVRPVSAGRVEVVRLFGPREATRTNVLRELMTRSYDVVHYAGHCSYDEKDPSASGWIFTGGHRLSARELNRVDRIPKFVFSNACESGITPDRARERDDRLAPSFAEAFFARGVSNFVCTAWPVDDTAARVFASRVFGGLLGVWRTTAGGYEAAPRIESMHEAMRQARLALVGSSSGRSTWGAYQHYGNPFFRLFTAAGDEDETKPLKNRRRGIQTASGALRLGGSARQRARTKR